MNVEEYEKAIPFYEEAQHKDADDMNLRRIAQCYYELGDYDKFLTFDFQKIQMTNYIREIDFNEVRYTFEIWEKAAKRKAIEERHTM